MGSASADPVVRVEGLRKSYGTHEAVKGIDFEVQRGEIFGFLGTNGAGKTTSIEILEGYRSRTGGMVSVLGVDPAAPTAAWRERIGLVLQDSELDPVYTVRETVTMFSHYYASPRSVDTTIEMVGLREQHDARIGSLSGGQRRRVDVALGIIGNPELLFLDEPTTGFDPQARRDFWSMIEGLRDEGTTIFLTTHYMDEAQHLADRLVILSSGEVVAAGTAAALTRQVGGDSLVRFGLPGGTTVDAISVAVGAMPSVSGQEVTLSTSDPQSTLLRLLSWADAQHLVLDDLLVTRPSLDDVFLALTSESADATPGSPQAAS